MAYACFYQGGSRITADFCTLLNESNQKLEIVRKEQEEEGKKQKILRLQDLGLSKNDIIEALDKRKPRHSK